MDRINFLPTTKDVIIIQKEARRKFYEASLNQDKKELMYMISHMRQGAFKSLRSATDLAKSVMQKQRIIDIKRTLV